MADEIRLDEWCVTAARTPDGALEVVVTRDGLPQATLVVPMPDDAEPEGRGAQKLKRDMDF